LELQRLLPSLRRARSLLTCRRKRRSIPRPPFTWSHRSILFTGTDRSNLDGIVGGGQIGYNWQMQNWLFGFEADIQGTGEKGTHNYLCAAATCTAPVGGPLALVIPGPALPFALNQKIDWFGTVRGRIGVLATPKVLFYATGGLAYGEVDTGAVVGTTPYSTVSSTNVGWTVGAGVEGAIGGNWTARLEYLYVDLGKASGSFLTTTASLGGGVVTENYSSRITDNILRVGINYKFGGSPVMAKY
jgi:outer membrane immunogenic protein